MGYARKKITLVMLICLSVLSVCIFAYYSEKEFKDTVITNAKQNLLTHARIQARYLETTVKYAQEGLKTLALESEEQDFILSGTDKYRKVSPREQNLYNNLQCLDLQITSMYRLDANGIVQNRIPFAPDRPGMDFSQKSDVKDVLKTQKSCVSDIFTSVEGIKSISICQPVCKDGQFIGIIRCLISLDNIQNLMATISKDKTGYIEIINYKGELIVHPQTKLVGQNLVEARRKQHPSYDWSGLEKLTIRMTKGLEGIESFQTSWFYENSPPRMVAFTPIHIGGKLWSLGVTATYNEIAGGSVGTFSRNLLLGATALILIIILIGIEFIGVKKREINLIAHVQSATNLKEINETLVKTNQQLQAEITDRKRTEQALNKSISKFSRVMNGASDGFWDWDMVTNEFYLSPKYKEMLGYENYELESSYQAWESRIHPDDHKMVILAIQNHLENCVPIDMDCRFKTKTGEYKWFNIRGQADYEQEKPVRISGSMRNITDMKITQKNLEENEHFLSNVFSSVQDGISILDKDMNILRVNPAMERWYSHMMPITGKKCYKVYHGRDVACDMCPSLQTLETGKPACEISPKTGSDKKIVGWFDLYSFPMFDKATGELKGVIEYVRDISYRKKIEDELSETKNHLLYLLKSTPAVIYSTKASGDYAVTFIGDNITDQFGHSPDEFLSDSKFWFNHIHPDDREKLSAELANINTKGRLVCEYRLLRKDGTYQEVHNAANLICDSNGNPAEIVGFIIDVTECKKAAKQESETLAAG
jgi:PAS domain S-box-containing protein